MCKFAQLYACHELFPNLRLTTKSDRKAKSGGRYSQVVNRKPNFEEKNCLLSVFFLI
jgi:hypothetical protein